MRRFREICRGSGRYAEVQVGSGKFVEAKQASMDLLNPAPH